MYSMYTTTNSDTMICSGSNISSIDRWLSVVPLRFHRELADIPFDMQTQWPWDITGRPAPGEKGQRDQHNFFLLKMDPDAVNNWNDLKSVKNRRIFGENRVTLISTLIVAPKKTTSVLLSLFQKQAAGRWRHQRCPTARDCRFFCVVSWWQRLPGYTIHGWEFLRLNQRRVMVAPSSVRVSQKRTKTVEAVEVSDETTGHQSDFL